MTTTMTSPKPRASGAHRVRETALTVGAIAGLICIAATVAGLLFHIKPLIFQSGSMAPEITTGSLAFSRTVPVGNLSIGDVVSVENAYGTRITHRVYGIQPAGDGTATVVLKGDANNAPDVEPYAITEADRVFWSVPGLGYVAAWLSSSTAVFLGGVFAGVLLMLVAKPSGHRGDDRPNTDPDNDIPHGGRTQTP
ncbi:signal peptidase I [Prescottella subtropica]|uniref:signal peptidase I n=1 Tax=Prescottella subtropica TaxID=2545757 RepID=UPI001F4F6188|nr:signal peptidase I [Prescottella subtropica]